MLLAVRCPAEEAVTLQGAADDFFARHAGTFPASHARFHSTAAFIDPASRSRRPPPLFFKRTRLTLLLHKKRDPKECTVSDITLADYLAVKQQPKFIQYLPHTAGRWSAKRFRKAQMPLVERLVCSLMMHGRNNGKKLKAVRIVQQSFEIIHLLTGQNPIQVLLNAVSNAGPREDATRVGSAGTVRRQAVDVSPYRRVSQALYLLTQGARAAAFRNTKTIAECLADELINAAKPDGGSSASYAIRKKDEIERLAKSSR